MRPVRRYETEPSAPRAERFLVARGTNRVFALGLVHGDVVEVYADGTTLVLRAVGHAPPRHVLRTLVEAGVLTALR